MTNPCVFIAAGGTGGHVYPGLAAARAFEAYGLSVIWIGTKKGLEAKVIPEQGLPIEWLRIQGLRGKGALSILFAPWRLLQAVTQASAYLKKHKPVLVLGMGGFVSGPMGLAAWLNRIPLVIHEQNAYAGMTNRYLSYVAKRSLEGFPGALPASPRIRVIGNPVRQEVIACDPPEQRFAGRTGPMRILVVGGSLGAVALNEVVPQALAKFPEAQRPLVRHQTGLKNLQQAQEAYAQAGVSAQVDAFIEDMAAAYAWADLVVCRSGALTVAELAAVGVGALLVPYPYAVDDHQTVNGEYLTKSGAADLIQQRELSVERLFDVLSARLASRDDLLEMAKKARTCALPNATDDLIKACQEALAEKQQHLLAEKQ